MNYSVIAYSESATTSFLPTVASYVGYETTVRQCFLDTDGGFIVTLLFV